MPEGDTVYLSARRGKHLLTRFDSGLTPHTHVKMDGTWRRYAAGEKWTGRPDWQIRAILGNDSVTAVGYRLAVVDLIRTTDEHTVVGHARTGRGRGGTPDRR